MNLRSLLTGILLSVFAISLQAQSATLDVVYPNGGEALRAGTTVNVEYNTSTTSVSNIVVGYSVDSGATWFLIETDTPTMTMGNLVSWTIPDTVSLKCLVRVTQGGVGTLGADTSDAVFTIYRPAPAVVLGNDTSICSDFPISITPKNIYPDYDSYSWSTGETSSSLMTTGSVLGVGIHEIILEVTDTLGEKSEDTIVVTVNQSPDLDLGGDVSVCYGDTFILDGGPARVKYLWDDGSTDRLRILDSTTHSLGTYTFWVVVDSTNGCKARDSITIEFVICNNIRELHNMQAKVSPNPVTNGQIFFNQPYKINRSEPIGLYTLDGRMIMTWDGPNIEAGLGLDKTVLPGMYLIRYVVGDQPITEKLLVN